MVSEVRSSMTSSSSIAPLVRRSAATTTPVATPAPITTGTQPLSAAIDVASARLAKPIQTLSPLISFLIAEQACIDRIAHAMNRQKMHLLYARGHPVRHADVDIVGGQEFARSSAALAGERDHAHAAFVRGVDCSHDARRVSRRGDCE